MTPRTPGKLSPNLLKPSDLFQQLKKRKLNSDSGPRKKLFVSPLRSIIFTTPEKNYQSVSQSSSRRKGTPRKTPKKTPRKTPRKTPKRALVFGDEKPSLPLGALSEDANLEAPTVKTVKGLASIPIDWSLKTRVRFWSDKPFPYKGYFSSSESANGTTSFVRCSGDEISATAKLKKHCFVWRHPHLPGFDLFPRINNRCKVAPISKPMSEDLLNEYCASLKDLFDLMKCRQVAYFYLCAYSFTALFRASGVAGVDEIHVWITPTTDGFRNLLKEEGIEFSMPLCEKTTDEESSSAMDEEEDANNFLETLGVDLSNESSSIKSQRTKTKPKKNTNSTLVMVKGAQVQDLIPFLSSSKIVLSKYGSLANIPPTLLAPVAFEGAQLHFLKLNLNSILDKSMYNIELCGPILPNMVVNLCELFRSTVGDFSCNLINYDYCGPFASVASHYQEVKEESSKNIFAAESLRDCGLYQSFIEDMCSPNNQSSSCINTISCKDGRYFVK